MCQIIKELNECSLDLTGSGNGNKLIFVIHEQSNTLNKIRFRKNINFLSVSTPGAILHRNMKEINVYHKLYFIKYIV